MTCEELPNSGDVSSPAWITESSRETPQNLSCSFASIICFCPQRFLCCSILGEKEVENNFHPGLILLVQAILFQAVPVEQMLERLWTLAGSPGEIFPVSYVACEDKQEKLGWDLSSPTSERASSLASGNQ